MNEWIEWKGGECPVECGAMVDVKLRNGRVSLNTPALMFGYSAYKWCHAAKYSVDSNQDVVAYRRHKPDEHVWTNPPTIEQLAADYREKLAIAKQAQEEADSHRCGAEAAMNRLQLAGKELGLVIAPDVE